MTKSSFESCTLKILQTKVKRTLDSVKKRVRKSSRISLKVMEMLAREFHPPMSQDSLLVQRALDKSDVTSLVHSNKTLQKETKGLKRKIEKAESDLITTKDQAIAFSEARLEIEEKLRKMEKKCEEACQELKKTQAKH